MVACERRRHVPEVRGTTALGRLDQSYAGDAAGQRAAALALKFVRRLDGIPTGLPKERDERRRDAPLNTLHREHQGCVRVVGGLRLMDADVGCHRGTPAVAV